MCYKAKINDSKVNEPTMTYHKIREKLRFYAHLEYERYLQNKKCKMR